MNRVYKIKPCAHCGVGFRPTNNNHFCSPRCGVEGRLVETENGCLEFSGSRHRGYGRISVLGKSRSAHRFLWECHFGPVPVGLFVCHTCDNPPCCNIDHLYAGTAQDNSDDTVRAGHHAKKLDAEKVGEIKTLFDNGVRDRVIAEHYLVHPGTINRIRRGNSWRSVTG